MFKMKQDEQTARELVSATTLMVVGPPPQQPEGESTEQLDRKIARAKKHIKRVEERIGKLEMKQGEVRDTWWQYRQTHEDWTEKVGKFAVSCIEKQEYLK